MNILRNAMIRNSYVMPQKPAIVFDDRQITYSALNKRVNRLANALAKLGVSKGKNISILFRNQPEFIESFLALHKLGATTVPLNFRLVSRELAYQISNSESHLVIFDREFEGTIESIKEREELQGVQHYIMVGKTDGPLDKPFLAYEELLAGSGDEEPPEREITEEDISLLEYTSGTTGLPKAAAHNFYAGLNIAIMESTLDLGVNEDDIVLCVAPLFHIAGHGFCLYMAIMQGATIVVRKAFDPEDVLKTIEREKITMAFLVPTMANAIFNLKNIEQYDRTSFVKWLSTGEALPEKAKEGIRKYFPWAKVWENYGSTESGNVSRLSPHDIYRKIACAGLPVLTQQVRIQNDKGLVVRPGEVGEVCVKGPTVIKRYYKNPEETKKAFTDDGWFKTGDLASYDGEGYIYLVGRKKDMIISGGENIYPKEIEAVLFQHPKILDATVIGLPDAKWGESVCAVVVLKANQAMKEAEVIEFCKENLASYKKPKAVKFMDVLPRNASGKVLKNVLREDYKNEFLITRS